MIVATINAMIAATTDMMIAITRTSTTAMTTIEAAFSATTAKRGQPQWSIRNRQPRNQLHRLR
jgi:chlorite dismutase